MINYKILKLIFKRLNFKSDDYTIIEPDVILPPNIRNTIYTTIPIEEVKSFINISNLSTTDVKRQLRLIYRVLHYIVILNLLKMLNLYRLFRMEGRYKKIHINWNIMHKLYLRILLQI